MSDGTGRASERATAIEGFVDRLTRVREEVGNPSFRRMAKRSGVISHATLHDAVQGARLPSWTTVVEFAKACDADPERLRGPWEQAERAVSASGVPDPRPLEPAPVDGAPEEPAPDRSAPADRSAPDERASAGPASAESASVESAGVGESGDDVRRGSGASDDPAAPRSTRPSALLLAGAAALGAVLSLGAVATYGALADDEQAPAAALTPSSTPRAAGVAAPASPSCPTNSATHDRDLAPRTPGDGARKGSETPTDCGLYDRGTKVTKTWELRNNGNQVWEGRAMRRIDPLLGRFGCTTPETVPIPRTEPGGTARVSVPITTPRTSATCYVRWMIVDRDGNYAFPGQRPIFFTLRVR